MYTIRFITFNLDHEMDSFHFISNENDPIPKKLFHTMNAEMSH